MFTKKPGSDTPASVLDAIRKTRQPINEISQKMARAYRDKAGDDLEDHEDNRDFYKAHDDNTKHEDKMIKRRKKGIRAASAKIYGSAKVPVSEEEQLDEVSANTLASYRSKTNPSEGKMDNLSKDKWRKRLEGRTTAADKLVGRARVPVSEEEQIEELSTNTLKSYTDKARMSHKDLSNKAAEATSKGFWERDKKAQKMGSKLDNKAKKRADGIFRAGMKQDRRSLTEDLTKTTKGKYFRKDMTGIALDPKGKVVDHYRNGSNENFKVYKDSNSVFHLVDSKRQILSTWYTDNKEIRQQKMNQYGLDVVTEGVEDSNKREVGTDSLLKTYLDDTPGQTDGSEPKAVNENEQIDELSKGTLGRYVKAARNSEKEHDKASVGFAKIARGAEVKSSKDQEFRTKMFQRSGEHMGKAAKRHVGINKAVDKLVKEDEQIEEMSRWKKRAYKKAATADISKQAKKARILGDAADRAEDSGLTKTAARLRSKVDQAMKKKENRQSTVTKIR